MSPVAQKDPLRTLVIIELDSIRPKLPVSTFRTVPRTTLGQVPGDTPVDRGLYGPYDTPY